MHKYLFKVRRVKSHTDLYFRNQKLLNNEVLENEKLLTPSQIDNKLDKHYKKYFYKNKLKNDINIEDFYAVEYEVYIDSILKEYKNLNPEEKIIAKNILSNKLKKYDKVYRLMKYDIDNNVHPWFRSEKHILEYENIIYNNA